MGQRWTEKEKQLAIECKTVEELFTRYSKEIGDTTLSRVKSIWSHRQTLVKAQAAEAAKTEASPLPKGRIAFPDEAETLAHISNKLSELIELQKEAFDRQREQLIHLQGINSQMTGLTILFQRLASSKPQMEAKG